MYIPLSMWRERRSTKNLNVKIGAKITFQLEDQLIGTASDSEFRTVRAKVMEHMYGGRIGCDDLDLNYSYVLKPSEHFIKELK